MNPQQRFCLVFLAGIVFSIGAAPQPEQKNGPDEGIRITTEPYKQTPQRPLEMTLYFPARWTPESRRPAIVFFFGGGWRSGSPSQFAAQAKYLARRGMVSACADYRVKSKDNVDPKVCVEDAKSAVRWLRANAGHLGINPDKIVAAGGSAGGHLAACTGLTPDIVGAGEDARIPSTVCAMVLFNPVLNLTDARLTERLGGDEKLARLISPTVHLDDASPPSVLFYGSKDALLAQGQEYVERARALGIRADLHITPDQGHGFFNESPYREETMAMADEFLVSLGLLPRK